ncbi:MAG: ZIP family metal transporter [Patescibacteria group bacterium]
MAIFFIFLTFASTFFGGFLSFRYKDRLHLILGFTAGVLLGVVAFDLLPEIIDSVNSLGIEPIYPMMALVVGFFLFHSIEKWLLIHHAHEEAYGPHTHPTVGMMSAFAIIGHSFLDGMGIGLGFQISPEVGIPVAIAVISHAFSDGLNTVNLMLLHKNPDKKALKFLFMNAVAPVLGGLSTIFFTFSEQFLTLYLGFFAGFFLYIGASEVLPEAHSRDSSFKTVLATLFGVLLIFFATRLG